MVVFMTYIEHKEQRDGKNGKELALYADNPE